MLRNYLTIALRNLRNHRVYSVINVLGLGLSVACTILIFLLVRRHLGYDTCHRNGDRTVRMVTDIHLQTVTPLPGVPNPMAKAMRSEFSFIEKAAMRAGRHEALVSVPNAAGVPDKYKEEEKFAFVEPELFAILDLPLLRGDTGALREPNTALLTEKMARKYFGASDPLGKTFRLDNEVDLRVAGILRDLPDNTDYRDEILASWATLKTIPREAGALDSWSGINSDTYCFVLFREGHNAGELESALPAFRKKYRHPDGEDLFFYRAMPLIGLHFSPDYGAGIEKKYLWSLGFIGLFLLVTACVNFINMATAQALNRAREVGVRKSLGSTRGQLFWQFMFETGLIVAASVAVGVVMARFALPYLNEWTEQNLRLGSLGWLPMAAFLVALVVVVVFLAGAYPGVMQARFQPAVSLKGLAEQRQAGGISIRRVLVTTQFAISQVLIIGAAVVTAQIRFAQDADWGFRPGAILTLPVPETSKMNSLQQQISAIAGVKNVSLCFQPPASGSNNQTGIKFDNRPEGEPWIVNTKPADVHYLETFGLQLVAGRNLQPGDTIREYVVNETFVKKLNLASPNDVINKTANIDGVRAPVVGVVRDFHNWALSEPVAAIAISTNSKAYSTCAVELNPGNPAPVLAQIKRIWESNYPNHYYEYKFMDERMAEFLETETMILRLVRTFAGIAIFIGCLGLYGLASFMVARKTKEIGIRKTLGASVPAILWIFGKEYVRLILIAFAVAAPVAWWAMNGWLQDYAYRISPGVGVFGLSLLATFLVAALTVGYQSVKAALANPVQSLRSEG